MLDRNKRRHPLETFLSNIDQDNSKQSPEVSVGIQLGYDYVNLRGDPSNNDFVSAVEMRLINLYLWYLILFQKINI